MNKVTLILVFFGLFIVTASAQKVGYVDSEDIMSKIPEYQSAQQEIERVSGQWQDELEERYQAIEQLYADYRAQEVLLPDDVKKEKQDEIFEAEREAKAFREEKFGYNGELFDLQEGKIKPIQEKLFRAVEKVAKRRRIDFVFDKAGEVTWFYTNANYNLSDDVLQELGYSQGGQGN